MFGSILRSLVFGVYILKPAMFEVRMRVLHFIVSMSGVPVKVPSESGKVQQLAEALRDLQAHQGSRSGSLGIP